MTIDLSQIITNLQSDVDAADSDTSMRDILSLFHRGKKVTELYKWYDSAGVLPIDSAYNGYMAFTKSDNTMRVFNDSDLRWAELDSALELSSGYNGARQGTNYGYVHGGRTIPASDNVIEKYPLAADANSTDVGDLTSVRSQMTGASYPTHGYVQGGYSTFQLDNIEKVSNSTDGNATDVANLTEPYRFGGGTQSATHGYTVGNLPASNLIQKHQFSNDGDGTDVGDLLATNNRCNGTSASETDGYLAGGYQPTDPSGDWTDRIQKFPFATDANSTDVGNLIHIRAYNAGTNGTTHGYSAGGQGGVPLSFAHDVTIEKYSYSTDGNSTDVGDLTVTASQAGHASSTTHGYQAGGSNPIVNVIQKYSFSSDGNATDVGDTVVTYYDRTGTQY